MKTKKLNRIEFINLLSKEAYNYSHKMDRYREDYWSVETPFGWMHGLYSKEDCRDMIRINGFI